MHKGGYLRSALRSQIYMRPFSGQQRLRDMTIISTCSSKWWQTWSREHWFKASIFVWRYDALRGINWYYIRPPESAWLDCQWFKDTCSSYLRAWAFMVRSKQCAHTWHVHFSTWMEDNGYAATYSEDYVHEVQGLQVFYPWIACWWHKTCTILLWWDEGWILGTVK